MPFIQFIKSHSKRVIKVPAGHEADIFDNARFIEQLSQCTGFEALYRKNILCTLRLSFIKGWGDNYRKSYFHQKYLCCDYTE